MPQAWFRGAGKRNEVPVELPVSPLERHTDPAGYLADPGLVDAVNVALYLGQPLLLTGQPGTGKTQLAYSLAWELGFDKPLKFETKSTSVARDLFYTYDSLGRFHAVQTGEGSVKAIDYIRFNALGLAILHANEPERVRDLLAAAGEQRGRRRSVVLVDEIDKAPRDFPNDLLNEIEGMYFKIPELGNVTVSADPALRPVLVLTSNSEKNLAEAFLRRCVFYDIPFPEPEPLRRVVHSRLGEAVVADRELLDGALELFYKLRDRTTGLLKPPSTGEFLAWLRVLGDGTGKGSLKLRGEAIIEPTLSCLIKTMEDRPKARELLKSWLDHK
jgi:MoxR-like ATPase